MLSNLSVGETGMRLDRHGPIYNLTKLQVLALVRTSFATIMIEVDTLNVPSANEL